MPEIRRKESEGRRLESEVRGRESWEEGPRGGRRTGERLGGDGEERGEGGSPEGRSK